MLNPDLYPTDSSSEDETTLGREIEKVIDDLTGYAGLSQVNNGGAEASDEASLETARLVAALKVIRENLDSISGAGDDSATTVEPMSLVDTAHTSNGRKQHVSRTTRATTRSAKKNTGKVIDPVPIERVNGVLPFRTLSNRGLTVGQHLTEQPKPLTREEKLARLNGRAFSPPDEETIKGQLEEYEHGWATLTPTTVEHHHDEDPTEKIEEPDPPTEVVIADDPPETGLSLEINKDEEPIEEMVEYAPPATTLDMFRNQLYNYATGRIDLVPQITSSEQYFFALEKLAAYKSTQAQRTGRFDMERIELLRRRLNVSRDRISRANI